MPFDVMVTVTGETTTPVFAEILMSVLAMAPTVGLTANPPPPPLVTLAVTVPVPDRNVVTEFPQDMLNAVGDTLNGVVVTVVPLAPRMPSTVDVSILRPVASLTINVVLPQFRISAVKLPPLVRTTGVEISAKPGNGDATK